MKLAPRVPRRLRLSVGLLPLLFAHSLAAQTYEGYGYATQGGAGGSVYHVTSLADSGAGTLRDGITNRTSARIIVFDVGGTITLLSDIVIRIPNLTVDGSTAPSPGITITHTNVQNNMVIAGTHDIILRDLRFRGAFAGEVIEGGATLRIDGDTPPDRVAQRIVLDHLTLTNSADGGTDIWGEARDITISWCLIYRSPKPTTISHYPAPYQIRQRISMHHNVYAENGERNPQIRADVRTLDFVNNIIYGWDYFGTNDGYAIRIRNEAGEPKVNGNFINNAIVPGARRTGWGLVYGSQPGSDSTDGGPSGTPAQGTVVTTSDMGSLWVAGNILPANNQDQYSTITAPIATPTAAQVTTWPASELGARIPATVGMKYRDATEQAVLNNVMAALPSTPSLSIGDVTVAEGNTGTTTATFTVTLSPVGTQTVDVNWATANDTATAGSDYVASSGALSFPAGTTTRTLSVTVNGDTTSEGNETFFVNLSGAVNAAIADSQGRGTITNDDAAPVSLSVGDVSLTEGNSGTKTAVFTVTLSASSTQAVTVDYATANGTATAGSDYVATASNLSFAAGTTTRTLSVTVNGDTTNEPNETLFVNLTNAAGATLADAQAVGTITNDDGATPALVVNTTTVAPGQSITVTVQNGPGSRYDWVSLNVSTAADATYLDWKYLNGLRTAPPTGLTTATLTFTMPGNPGTYNFRLFANGGFGKLTTSATVTVAAGAGPSLAVNATTVVPGAPITVNVFNGPGNTGDWVGVYGTATADSLPLDWKYLSGTKTPPTTGVTTTSLTFAAPLTVGTYNFRLFASGGYQKLAVTPTVTVQAGTATLTVSASIANPGQTVQVTVQNGPGNPKDWVALYVTTATDSSYLDWKYLNGTRTAPATGLTSATFAFAMPTAPGTYQFRFFRDNTYSKLATSANVAVGSSVPVLTVSTLTVSPGQNVSVIVQNGPGSPSDWLGFHATSAADSVSLDWKYLNGTRTAPTSGLTTATVTFTMPTTPGTYNFRLFASGGWSKLATSSTVTVQSQAAPTLTVSATAVAPGQTVTVTVQNGPGNAKDWIGLHLATALDAVVLDWKYLNGTRVAPAAGLTSATVTFAMPATPGQYNFRIFQNDTYTKLATAPTVTVQ